MKRIKLALHWQMCIALALGALCGLVFGSSFSIWGNYIKGVGNLFLHAINMIVIPLVFLSTVLSISALEEGKSMGSVAVKTFMYFIVTALLAALIAVVFTDVFRPGVGMSGPAPDAYDTSDILAKADEAASVTWMDKLVAVVPSNIFQAFTSDNMLPIVFFSLLFGYFVRKMQQERKNDINTLFDELQEVIIRMTTFIIRLMPIGVFAIVMALIGENKGAVMQDFKRIALFVLTVWAVLIVMGGVVLPIMVGLMAKVSPLKHLKQIYSALMVAFSTSSSYSALPLIISDAKEKFGVSDNVASFTVPLGITFNKIGTIIYECVAVIFVSQACNMGLSATQQVSLIGASIVAVLGAPALPMAGVITLAVLLKAMGLPETYIGIFMAVDILCDMPKTLLNAYSVSCSAIIVAKTEGEKLTI